MLPFAVGAIFLPARRNCSLFVGWRDQREMRFRLHLSTPSVHDCSHKVPKASSQSTRNRSDQAFGYIRRSRINHCLEEAINRRRGDDAASPGERTNCSIMFDEGLHTDHIHSRKTPMAKSLIFSLGMIVASAGSH